MEEKLKIAILGYGHVGKHVHELFKNKEDIYIYDPALKTSNTKEEINRCDLSIICVPTEPKEDGGCDISIVEESVNWVETPLILIKSTIPPGTTDFLKEKYKKRIVFSPEYVGESKYHHSYWNSLEESPFHIFGGDKKDIIPILNVFLRYCGPEKRYVQTDAKSAELTKYFENTFFAAKVTLVNEFYDICKALCLDWNEVRELWLLDPRINRMHTAVFPDNRGFGGKCYPKDLSALIHCCNKQGYTPKLLEAVKELNKEFRKKSTPLHSSNVC